MYVLKNRQKRPRLHTIFQALTQRHDMMRQNVFNCCQWMRGNLPKSSQKFSCFYTYSIFLLSSFSIVFLRYALYLGLWWCYLIYHRRPFGSEKLWIWQEQHVQMFSFPPILKLRTIKTIKFFPPFDKHDQCNWVDCGTSRNQVYLDRPIRPPSRTLWLVECRRAEPAANENTRHRLEHSNSTKKSLF